jgi:hypothetical protein
MCSPEFRFGIKMIKRTHDRRIARASQRPEVFDRMPRGAYAVKVTTKN